MKKPLYFTFTIIFLAFLPLSGCDENGDVVIFSIEQDRQLGAEVAAEIANNPDQFPILPESQYPEAYAYLGNMMDEILSSEAVNYREEFAYDEFKIIHDDETLNAFATPGGYIYIYTGLIKYLDTEDHLAGVLGHEIAHSEQRHTSKTLQRNMGIQFLLGLVFGEAAEGAAAKVLTQIGSLTFSRGAESEADEFSVTYLADTKYECDGAAGFFRKLNQEGSARIPEFLSTHPNPDNRVEAIEQFASTSNCDTTEADPMSYQNFKDSLPD